MASKLTPEESKQESIRVMGKNLGELYYLLWQELAWLHSKWIEFVELFSAKPSRIDLMNETAPYFFRIVEDVLWENIVLGIARLTDPPQSFGKDNLTICKIPDYIIDKGFRDQIKKAIDDAKTSTSFCRDWRNRRYAHLDFLLSTNKKTKQLELATVEKTKKALSSIAKVLNLISCRYNNSTTAFDFTVGTPGDANSLLYYLHFGLKAENEKRERIINVKELPNDFEHPDI